MLTLSLESDTEVIDLNQLLDTDEGAQAISGLTGLGLPALDTFWTSGAGDGAAYRGTRVLPRDIDLPLFFASPDRAGLKEQVARLSRVLSGEAILRIVDEEGERYAVVVRVGGGDLVYGEDTTGSSDLAITVTLRAGVPFWIASTETAVTQTGAGITSSITLTNEGTVKAYPVWELHGPGKDFKATAPDGSVLEWNGQLLNGEILYIDTATGTAIDHLGESRYGSLAPAPRFTPVKPGENVFGIEFPNATVGRTNLVPNPSFETNATGWAATTGTIARSTAQAFVGTASLAVTTAGESVFFRTPTGTAGIPVTAGLRYAVQARIHLVTPHATITRRLRFYNASGTHIGVSVSTLLLPVGWWSLATALATPPVGAAYMSIEFSGVLPDGAASQLVFYLDAVMADQSSDINPYFDGATVDTATNVYAWTGTAHASPSTLSITPDRSTASITGRFRARDWMVI